MHWRLLCLNCPAPPPPQGLQLQRRGCRELPGSPFFGCSLPSQLEGSTVRSPSLVLGTTGLTNMPLASPRQTLTWMTWSLQSTTRSKVWLRISMSLRSSLALASRSSWRHCMLTLLALMVLLCSSLASLSCVVGHKVMPVWLLDHPCPHPTAWGWPGLRGPVGGGGRSQQGGVTGRRQRWGWEGPGGSPSLPRPSYTRRGPSPATP